MSEQSPHLYYGARVALDRGDEIPPREGFVYFSPDLDAAIWAAELAEGDGEPHVYKVAATGSTENAEEQPDYTPPRHPAMSWRSREPLTVLDEVTEWNHYHGTRADLRPGDLIQPGYAANFGAAPRTANFVYFARTLDAATWGAELAAGERPGRIYLVEPTGEVEDDPNLTNRWQSVLGRRVPDDVRRAARPVRRELRRHQQRPRQLRRLRNCMWTVPARDRDVHFRPLQLHVR